LQKAQKLAKERAAKKEARANAPTSRRLQNIIAAIDDDGSGTIDEAEFKVR